MNSLRAFALCDHDIVSSGPARRGRRRKRPASDKSGGAAYQEPTPPPTPPAGAAEHHGPRRGRAAPARRHAPPLRPTRRRRSSRRSGPRTRSRTSRTSTAAATRDFEDDGYDCSGTVSYALHGGGLLDSPLDSGSFMKWGEKGAGTWITVYTNPGHAYAVIAGLRLDTSAASVTRAEHAQVQEGARARPALAPHAALVAGLQGAPPARLLARHLTAVPLVGLARYAWSDSTSPTTQGREVPWPACPGGSPQ